MKKVRPLILPITLFILSFIPNAAMDLLSQKHSESIFSGFPDRSFWGSDSWVMKYEGGQEGQFKEAPDTWYYTTFDLSYKEAFPLSGTALVFLTDGWHLAKSIQLTLLALSLTIMAHIDLKRSVLFFIVIRLVGSFVFEIFYSVVLK